MGKLSRGQYADAFTSYAKDADFLLSYYEKEGEAYDPNNQFSFIGAGISALLSGLTALGVRSHLISSMSNVAPSFSASQYLDQNSFQLLNENDQYLYTNRIVTPIPRKGEGIVEAGGSMGGGGGGHGGGGGKF